MQNVELPTTTSATSTPIAWTGKRVGKVGVASEEPKTDVARQRAWLSGIDAEDFYANVPCTD